MRIVTNIFFMLIIFNLISCKKKVDCNGDLVYEDGLTYYKGELYTGNCESFFQNGNLMNQQSYFKGMDDGIWYFYFENGQLETKGEFIKNKKVNKWEYYYDSGALKQVSYYKNGLKDSIWLKFSNKGEILWEKKFKEDKQINSNNNY